MSLAGEERKEYIVSLLESNGKVRTVDLIKRFNVSSETIRRYLEELEKENKLKRVYGGAVKIDLDHDEPSHLNREVLHSEEKKKIGKMAAGLVQDNDIVIIDEGTTPLQMIPHLIFKNNLTIITSSIPALSRLISYDNKGLFSGEIIIVGGTVQSKHLRVAGSICEHMMDNIYADKAFIAVDGVLTSKGITGNNVDKSLLSKKYIDNSRQSIVLADHSKIGTYHFYKISDLKDIDTVISNVSAPGEWSQYLKEYGVGWMIAD